jgi:hypothetical protein
LKSKPPPSPEAQREQERARVKRQAIRQLRRTKLIADKAGVDLSEWEGEFLGSVEERVRTYGRAFADPEKGGRGAAFSALQTVKLKEIAAKAKGEKRPGFSKSRKGFRRTGETGSD